jgi:uncharacterized protein (TIGR03067 family)
MQQTWLVAVVAGAFLAVGGDTAKPDKEKLQGVWVTTEITSGGKKADLEVRMEFKGDKVTMTRKGQPGISGTYTIDPDKSPATMDITLEKEGKKQAIPAIYELKGDELKLCHPFGEGGARPTTFEASTKTVLATLKRQKF